MGFGTTDLEKLEHAVSLWPKVSVHPHRFGGREFRFGAAEISHVHVGGIVDIPFTRSIHDALLSEGLAEEHQWLPNSGWVTFRFRTSYLRQALKTANYPYSLVETESEELQLSSRFKALLEAFIRKSPKPVPAEPVSA
jgi:hypothetical protein